MAGRNRNGLIAGRHPDCVGHRSGDGHGRAQRWSGCRGLHLQGGRSCVDGERTGDRRAARVHRQLVLAGRETGRGHRDKTVAGRHLYLPPVDGRGRLADRRRMHVHDEISGALGTDHRVGGQVGQRQRSAAPATCSQRHDQCRSEDQRENPGDDGQHGNLHSGSRRTATAPRLGRCGRLRFARHEDGCTWHQSAT